MAFAISTRATATGASRRVFLKAVAGLPLAARADAALAGSNSEKFRGLRKAMWAWKVGTDDLAALKAFADAVGIDTVLWSVPPQIRAALADDDRAAAPPVRALREEGRALFALTGDPGWVQSPQRMPRSLGQLVQAAAADPTTFDGVALDVEPNALPGWHDPAQRKRLMDDTVAFYDMVRSKAPHVPLDAALNPAFAGIVLQNDGTLLEALLRRIDSVSLMAYRDSAEGTMTWAAPAIEVIERMGVPWRLGVLVHGSSEAGTSFSEYRRPDFEAEMIALDDLVHRRGPSASYRGLIFEDYNGLARILRA